MAPLFLPLDSTRICPLTSIKGYLQLVIEAYATELDDKVISIIKNVLSQFQILEKKIVEHLDKF